MGRSTTFNRTREVRRLVDEHAADRPATSARRAARSLSDPFASEVAHSSVATTLLRVDVPVVEEVWLRIAGRAVALHVLELGLACCGIEVREARRAAVAAGAVMDRTPRNAEDAVARAAEADGPGVVPLHVLVVAGTVTVQLAPVVVAALADLPEPRAVLAFGACAATGGPYWDSYAVLPGAHEVVDVDAWVAGCPPRPADLLAGLEEVVRGRP